jgi:predicted transcriptional regulator of viral defense system
MDDIALIRILEKGQLSVFTTQQLAVELDMDISSAAVRLNRLVKRGVLQRIMRGRYVLPSVDIISLASNIYIPSYVSLLAAFAYHGTTTQSPKVIDVINPIHSSILPIKLDKGNFEIRFIKVHPNLIYGYTKFVNDGKVVLIAEKEKAVVDSLLFTQYVNLDEAATTILEGIDKKKTIEYAIRTKRQSVMKRLGHLLSAKDIICNTKDFPKLSDTFVPLDPHLPRRGKYDKKWRVIVNRVIE